MHGDPIGAVWLAATGAVLGLVFAVAAKKLHGRPITPAGRLLVFAVPTAASSLAGLALLGAIELHGVASAVCLFACGAALGAFYGVLQYLGHRQLRRVLWPTLVMGLGMLTLLSSELRDTSRLLAGGGSLLFLATAALERRFGRRRPRFPAAEPEGR